MNRENLNKIAERLVITIRVININNGFGNNANVTKFNHEFKGMTLMLKTMEINFAFGWNEDVTKIVSVNVGGVEKEV